MTLPVGTIIQVFDDDVDLGLADAMLDDTVRNNIGLTSFTNTSNALNVTIELTVFYDDAPDDFSSMLLFYTDVDGPAVPAEGAISRPNIDFFRVIAGSIPIAPVAGLQTNYIDINLISTKTDSIYDFALYNRTGQTISDGWGIRLVPTAERAKT